MKLKTKKVIFFLNHCTVVNIFNDNGKSRINARDLFRYIPSEHSSYYDNSGSYYNLMTDSKHNVEEPRVVEKQIEQLLEDEVLLRIQNAFTT